MGMPEETQETLMDTYNLIKEIDFDKIHLMNIAPFPCTEVFEQAKKDGILMNIDTKDMYKADDLYFKNYERFFIKPYKLEVSEMLDFRCKCEELINKKPVKGKTDADAFPQRIHETSGQIQKLVCHVCRVPA